jgi:endonuclease/exonuclease/phosphatase family metal-dependent hydrolase
LFAEISTQSMVAATDLVPGVVFHYAPAGGVTASAATGTTLRVVDWNIERGYKLPALTRELRGLDADVLLLQELDVGCGRSAFADVPQHLADALGMHCAFLVEFRELVQHDAPRSAENEAGLWAFHGNAIMSRYPFRDIRAIQHTAAVDWGTTGTRVCEPRVGHRGVLTAELRLPRDRFAPHTSGADLRVQLYCMHLEIFCGVLMRVRQYGDAVADAKELADRRRWSGDEEPFRAVIAGDFNTIAHGLARLGANVAKDRMRFLMCGETEAEWFARCVLDPRGVTGNPLYGIRSDERVRLRNTLHLTDPFDVFGDTTLDNPKYHGFVRGKLDWLLLCGLDATATCVGNLQYDMADHRYLVADVRLAVSAGDVAEMRQLAAGHRHRQASRFRRAVVWYSCRCATVLAVVAVAYAVLWVVS